MGVLSINESSEMLLAGEVLHIQPCRIVGFDPLRRTLIETLKEHTIDMIEERTLRYIITESYMRSSYGGVHKCEVKFYRMPWMFDNMQYYIPEHVLVYVFLYLEDHKKMASPFMIVGPGTDKLNPIRPRGLNFQNILSTYYAEYQIATAKEICRYFSQANPEAAIRTYLRNAGLTLYSKIHDMLQTGG